MRRRADLVFASARVAVFVDGCFWHGCPEHATWPKANAEFWRKKIETNKARDANTNEALTDAGWLVLRFWEHDDPHQCVSAIATAVRRRMDGAAPKKEDGG
jgi:DNA mismatch endonuclease (patch repair protein)